MYRPMFRGPIEGWTVNYTHPLFWRVENIMEWKDVLQEAYIVFLRCQAKYPVMDTAQHFMSLYKTAWTRHFIDMTNTATALRQMVPHKYDLDDGEDMVSAEPVGDTDNDGAVSILVAQAPEEVRRVITLMLNAPQELLDVLLADWKGHDARRKDGGGKRINQALGLPLEVDVYRMVREYFTG